MRIIEINALDNGAHNNQNSGGPIPVPAGWAIIPEGMVCENFPFGDVVVDASEPPVVTKWIPGVIPEPEPEPVEPEPSGPSVWDDLQAAYEEGVNSVD